MKKRVFPEFVFNDEDLSDFEAAVMFGRWFMDCLGDELSMNKLVSLRFYVRCKFAWIGRRGFKDRCFDSSKLKLGDVADGRKD